MVLVSMLMTPSRSTPEFSANAAASASPSMVLAMRKFPHNFTTLPAPGLAPK